MATWPKNAGGVLSGSRLPPPLGPMPWGVEWGGGLECYSASGNSHHPGCLCGLASAGRCTAFGHCCRHERYLKHGDRVRGCSSQTPEPPLRRTGCGLTGRKAATKEHVKEVFWGDVSLKASVEVPVAVAVPGSLALVITKLVVLFPFLWVAEYGIRCANGCKGRNSLSTAKSSLLSGLSGSGVLGVEGLPVGQAIQSTSRQG
jgi:hypothetical protein